MSLLPIPVSVSDDRQEKETDPQSQMNPGGRLKVGFFSVATSLVLLGTAALSGLAPGVPAVL